MQPFHPYHLTETDQANEADRALVRTQIRQFNNAHSPHHLQIRTQPPVPLDLFLHDENQTLIGGLTASTYWSWLEIENLWLHESLRRQGYGQQLLARAEQLARERGCHWAQLTTFSFQARGFYEKCGYYVIGQLTDYPPGQTYFWLRKDFPTP